MILYGALTPLQRKDKIQSRLLELIRVRDDDCDDGNDYNSDGNNDYYNDGNGKENDDNKNNDNDYNNEKGNRKGKRNKNNKRNNGNSKNSNNRTNKTNKSNNNNTNNVNNKNNNNTNNRNKKSCKNNIISVINIKNIIDIKKSKEDFSIVEIDAITYMNIKLTMDKFKFNSKKLNENHKRYIKYIFFNSICPLKDYKLCKSIYMCYSNNDNDKLCKQKGSLFDEDRYNKEKQIANKEKYTDFMIIITGHGDTIGSHKANLKVALQRAKEVKKEFIKMGIPANKILIGSFGKIYPIFQDREMRDRSRRVDVWVRKRRGEGNYY
jgi:hypothetical protein